MLLQKEKGRYAPSNDRQFLHFWFAKVSSVISVVQRNTVSGVFDFQKFVWLIRCALVIKCKKISLSCLVHKYIVITSFSAKTAFFVQVKL